MLATLPTDVPRGAGWLFEVKWDGYRAIADLAGGEALSSRNGNDLTARFPGVARELVKAVKTPDCVLDGEVCALDDSGRSSFSAMQQGKPGRPSSSTSSTSSRSRGSRSSTCRSSSGASGSSRSSTAATRPFGCRRGSTTAVRCTKRQAAAAGGRDRQAARLAVPARAPHA